MFDSLTSDKLKELLPKIQTFLEDEVFPFEREALSMPFKEVEKILREFKPKIKEMGAWNPYLPKRWGGQDFTMPEVARIGEVLGQSPLGHFIFNCQAPDAGNIELLMHFGSDEMKEKYLSRMVEGEIRSCFSMTEPHFAGSNPVHMGLTAVRDGDEYVINGHKWFTSSADGAEFAIVMAITNPEAESPYARASQIIVPTNTPGFNFIRNVPVMGHAGEGWHSHAEIKYENVRVPVSNLIGMEGSGFLLAQERLGPGRIHHCMRWIGIAERCFDLMCKRAVSRELSPGKPLGMKQSVQNWIAESRAEINACRLMVMNAAHALQVKGNKGAREEISTIKFYTAEMLHRVINRAIQTHGALGVTDDTPLAFWYREERGASIYDGTNETHKASLAKKILKKYGVKVKNN